MNTIQNKKFFYSLITMLVASLIMILGDTTFFKGQELYYFAGRIPVILGFLYLLYRNIKDKNLSSNLQYFLWIITIFYSVHGQYFRPGYFLAYLQTLFFASLSCEFSAKKFIIAIFTGFGLLVVATHYGVGWSLYTTEMLKNDILFGAFMCSVLGSFVYYFATQQDLEYRKMYLSFYDVGKNAGSLLHDIKGQMQTPILYNEMMSFYLENNESSKIKEILIKQSSDLTALSKYIHNFNKLNSKSFESKVPINIEKIIDEASQIARLDFCGVTILIKNDCSLDNYLCNDVVILKALYNLMKNSNEAMTLAAIKNKTISINILNKKIEMKDNGPGFSKKVLYNIRKGNFSKIKSSKENGSGIGLFLIKDSLQEQKIKITYNNDSGAQVLIDFN